MNRNELKQKCCGHFFMPLLTCFNQPESGKKNWFTHNCSVIRDILVAAVGLTMQQWALTSFMRNMYDNF